MSQLKPPVGAGDHIQGDPHAHVTLLEYGDYECPHCGAAHPVLKQVMKKVGKGARFVFRNFPLSQAHPHAQQAAEAAEAAGAQGKFWEMHDLLFEHQDALETEDLIDYAKQLGLDTSKFATDLRHGTYAAKVKSDFSSGVRSGVNGTPTLFVEGIRLDGWDPDSLVAGLKELVKEKR